MTELLQGSTGNATQACLSSKDITCWKLRARFFAFWCRFFGAASVSTIAEKPIVFDLVKILLRAIAEKVLLPFELVMRSCVRFLSIVTIVVSLPVQCCSEAIPATSNSDDRYCAISL